MAPGGGLRFSPPGLQFAASKGSRTHPPSALSTTAPESTPRIPLRRHTPSPATTALALEIAGLLDEKLAESIAILDVSGPLVIADYFVVATVRNTRQAQALAKELDLGMKASRGRRKRNTGGIESENSSWVLLDFDDVVVHLFLPEARAYYGLESLWADVPRIAFTPAPRTALQPKEVRNPTLQGLGFGDGR